MELNALESVAPSEALTKFAVIGSGPLPLTSLCIFQALKDRNCKPACIHNLDKDATAILQSAKLCGTLGFTEEAICFKCADALLINTLDLYQFDVVFLAA